MKKVSLLAIAGLFVITTVHATLVRETFATDPALDGWQVFGDTNLFQWDATNQVLDVTWDSSRTNSYFYHPLGQTYTKNDGFYLRFDLQLNDLEGTGFGMELAIGLSHYSDVTGPYFSRADFYSPNVCEFDWFPAYIYEGTTYPDSVEATMIDDTGTDLFYNFDDLTPTPGVTYRIEIVHQPGAGSISCQISTNGQIVSSLPIMESYNGPIGDFQLDMLSVTSYQDDGFGDTLLAHGTVGNLAFASPLPIGLIQTATAGQEQFASDTNWVYTLEESPDLVNWAAAAPGVVGNGRNLLLQDTNAPAGAAFYRVRADLP